MTKDDSLKIISELSSVIGLLEGKWERPHTGRETAIIQTLLDVRETVRKDYEAREVARAIATELLVQARGELAARETAQKVSGEHHVF